MQNYLVTEDLDIPNFERKHIFCTRAKMHNKIKKKSRTPETPTLSTDADSRTDTNLKRKCLSFFFLSLLAAKGFLPRVDTTPHKEYD